jgi:hypothetical protein
VGALGFYQKEKNIQSQEKEKKRGSRKRDKDRNRMRDDGRNDISKQLVAASVFFFFFFLSAALVRCDFVLLLYLQCLVLCLHSSTCFVWLYYISTCV